MSHQATAREALDLPITDCAKLVRAGKVSPVALTEVALERIERIAPRLKCFVTVTADTARARAKAAEADLRRHYRGILHGLPFGLKDNINTKGIPTTWGSKLYEQRVPKDNATVAQRLHDSDAVLVGKLALTEFAMGVSNPHSSITGACRNPWDLSRWAGGSSSGPAAAVAARLIPFALGTDTAGSIIGPAANCGVTGFRSTYGVLSRAGVMPYAYTLDRVGPICRTAMDCAAVVDAIAGLDVRDDATVRVKPRGLARLGAQRAKGSRVAVMGFSPNEPVGTLFQNALWELDAAGLTLEKTGIPDLPYSEVAYVIMESEADVAFDDIIRSGHAPDFVDPLHHLKEWYWLTGRPSDYVRAQAIRTEMVRVMDEYFKIYDLIVSVNPSVAIPIDGPVPSTGGDFMNVVGALLGLPTVSVPMGFVDPGLPAGFSITGRWMDDARVLAAAALYQSRTDWHTRAPEL